MNVTITILVENTVPVAPLLGEYGFSVLVEADDTCILFDTGLGETLIKNADFLSKDLSQVDSIVISHGHFDHTGGVLPFIKNYGVRPLFCHPGCFVSRPHVLDNGVSRDIGSMFSEKEYRDAGGKITFTPELKEIAKDIFVTGEIPRKYSFEDVGGDFVKVESNGEKSSDFILDDMALVINHQKGLIIISGCAHAGIVNTIEYAKAALKQEKILCYFGGTHLLHADGERLTKTAGYLNQINLQQLVASHCTGFRASCYLSKNVKSNFIKGEVGFAVPF